MRYGIIAAGNGSRLADEGVAVPKPLVKVNGEALIDRLLRIFVQNDAKEICVVCNSKSESVGKHLRDISEHGLGERVVPLKYIVRDTPSSMHSAWALAPFLEVDDDGNEVFVLTTVDTYFDENEFAEYVRRLQKVVDNGEADGLMGVTEYVDDEKPLYVATRDENGNELITAFLDSNPDKENRYVSAGIYGLTGKALTTMQKCIERGEYRMRNFQRALIADGQRLLAFPMTMVIDIDHRDDITKAMASNRSL